MTLNALIRHIRLERRRIAVAGSLAFLAGTTLTSHLHGVAFGLPFPVFVGIAYAGLAMIAATFSTYFLPRLRHLVEAVALSRLLFALGIAGSQGYAVAETPLYAATIVVVGALGLVQIGTWLETRSRMATASVHLVDSAVRAREILDWIDNTATRRRVA